MTPREIGRVLKGSYAHRAQAHREARGRNHELARLIAFAYHDPKKMPEFEKGRKKPETPSQIDNERVRGFFIGMASRSK